MPLHDWTDERDWDSELWRRPLQAGQPLPTLPWPLSVHRHALVDLEATYQRAAKRAYLD